jgi:hypothetical protein
MRSLIRQLEEGAELKSFGQAILARGFGGDAEDAEMLADEILGAARPQVQKVRWAFTAQQWAEVRDGIEHDFQAGNPYDIDLTLRYPRRVDVVATMTYDVQLPGVRLPSALATWAVAQAAVRAQVVEQGTEVFLPPPVRRTLVERTEAWVLDQIETATRSRLVDARTGRSERASEIPEIHYQMDVAPQYEDATVRSAKDAALVTVPVEVRRVRATFPWDDDYDK